MRARAILCSVLAACIVLAAHRIVQLPPMWEVDVLKWREARQRGCMREAQWILSRRLAVYDGSAPISRVYWAWRDLEFWKELNPGSAISEERLRELRIYTRVAAKSFREADMPEESDYALELIGHPVKRPPCN